MRAETALEGVGRRDHVMQAHTGPISLEHAQRPPEAGKEAASRRDQRGLGRLGCNRLIGQNPLPARGLNEGLNIQLAYSL